MYRHVFRHTCAFVHMSALQLMKTRNSRIATKSLALGFFRVLQLSLFAAPTPQPTSLPTPRPTNHPTIQPTTPCKDDEPGLIQYLIANGKRGMSGLTHPCNTVLATGFCQSHQVMSKSYCSKTCNFCSSKSACAGSPCMNGGTCVPAMVGSIHRHLQSAQFTCQCAQGYSGSTCSSSSSE